MPRGTGEPPDRQIDLRFAHQPPIVHKAKQESGEHQPNGGLRFDPGPSDTGRVKVDHLIAQPGQIEHTIHPSQKVLVGNQVSQRAADKKFELEFQFTAALKARGKVKGGPASALASIRRRALSS